MLVFSFPRTNELERTKTAIKMMGRLMSLTQIFPSHFHFIKLPFPLKHYVKNGILLRKHAYLSPMNLNIAYKIQSQFYK